MTCCGIIAGRWADCIPLTDKRAIWQMLLVVNSLPSSCARVRFPHYQYWPVWDIYCDNKFAIKGGQPAASSSSRGYRTFGRANQNSWKLKTVGILRITAGQNNCSSGEFSGEFMIMFANMGL